MATCPNNPFIEVKKILSAALAPLILPVWAIVHQLSTRFPLAGSTKVPPTEWVVFKVMANTKVVGQFVGQGF